jgi:predicted amidophosphoribosyltransferase
MHPRSEAHPAVRFCPYCGQPLGSFFGARIEGGAVWCDRCQECFKVEHVVDSEDINDPPEPQVGGVEKTGEQ